MARQENWFEKYSKKVFGSKKSYIKSRKYVAKKIISRIGGPKVLREKILLDVGCSTGHITEEYARIADKVFGIDIDKRAIRIAEKVCKNAKCVFYNGRDFPFKDNTFDIIICNFVIEHVKNQEKLIDEIYRVCRKNGICYLSTDNKWRIVEAHYKLPFLSYLPQQVANVYVKLSGKGEIYYENPPTYKKLIRMLNKFEIYNKSIDIIKDPEKYHVKKQSFIFRYILRNLNRKTLEALMPLIPSFNLILKKSKKV